MPTAGSLSEMIPTAVSLNELPLHMQASPIKIRSVEPKGRTPPSPELPDEEKPSSDLAAVSYEVPKPSWDTNHVMAWRDADLPTPVYVRKDRLSETYHTYPKLNGPFRSLDEIQRAVDGHASGKSTGRSQGLTKKERVIQEFLQWPDGRNKVSTMSEIAEREDEDVERLVKALLDKQNEELEDEYELEQIVHWQSIWEGADVWFYHLNITVKTKGADDDVGSASLFFVEVTLDQNDTPGYFLSSFKRIDPGSNDEVSCHGCINNGSTDMKHPSAEFYNGGKVNICFPVGFGPCKDKQWRDSHNEEDNDDDDEDMIEEEDRIRASFDYLDDEAYMEELRSMRRANYSKVP